MVLWHCLVPVHHEGANTGGCVFERPGRCQAAESLTHVRDAGRELHSLAYRPAAWHHGAAQHAGPYRLQHTEVQRFLNANRDGAALKRDDR